MKKVWPLSAENHADYGCFVPVCQKFTQIAVENLNIRMLSHSYLNTLTIDGETRLRVKTRYLSILITKYALMWKYLNLLTQLMSLNKVCDMLCNAWRQILWSVVWNIFCLCSVFLKVEVDIVQFMLEDLLQHVLEDLLT